MELSMISLRPIALILALAWGPHAFAGEPGPAPDEPMLTQGERPAVAVTEPTATVISTSRKKRGAERNAMPVLETFPPTDTFQPARPAPGIERVVYDRAPLKIALSAGQERRIYLPWEAALHLPADAGGLHAQVIGSTLYLTGQSGQPVVRVIAEGLDGQGMIPLDVQVRDQATEVPGEMEISVATRSDRRAPARRAVTADDEEDDEPVDPDLVQLTRHCSQQLYAPQRLVKPLPGVRAVDVRGKPVAGLYRTSAVMTTPIGAWRSASRYVTAVRFTNRSQSEVELDMDLLRGRWVAATPQHHVLAPAGSEADTTAVCLISEQPFDAARP